MVDGNPDVNFGVTNVVVAESAVPFFFLWRGISDNRFVPGSLFTLFGDPVALKDGCGICFACCPAIESVVTGIESSRNLFDGLVGSVTASTEGVVHKNWFAPGSLFELFGDSVAADDNSRNTWCVPA